MNNEIKEILEFKEDADYKKISCDEIKILRDYITNLDQENERLKQPQVFIDTQDMEERYGEELYKDYLEEQIKDYKLRIEKAVEYIEYNRNKLLLSLPPREALDINVLLNILNGRSDE